MPEAHPNIALLMQLNLRDLDASAGLFADDFVWHYFNPNLPDLAGDFVGVAGLKDFFAALGTKTGGTFRVEPVNILPIGEEFVITHVHDTLELGERALKIDAIVVWRIVDGRLAEAWDIPAAHTTVNA